MIFNNITQLDNLSSINFNIFWNENGVESIFEFPESTYYRIENINNMVWQKIKALKQQRRLEEDEKERSESFKYIEDIINWVRDKGFKNLSKINLKLYLSEKKMTLRAINLQALYLEVNKKLKEECK
ncbi:MAG: hypothetical protein JXA99_08715 [Candidatus Lokiarchaeota archaeon]|nr:hypothetical protein [Candidatus Lokiarchaeota archaeon]